MFKKILLLVAIIQTSVFVYAQSPLASTLKINEYSCANRNFPDSYSSLEDWIELYNSSTAEVNLNNFKLQKNTSTSGLWTFPTGISIPAGGKIIIFCSGRNAAIGSNIHTNFRLSQIDGDVVYFRDASGLLIDSIEVVRHQMNHSVGRSTDGAGTWSFFTTPTPATANVGGCTHYAAKPTLSVTPGFYSCAVTVAITTVEPSATIRYTTNGTEPTATSTIYTSPITVSNTQVIRARVFSNVVGVLPSFIETNTYFINASHTLPVFSICGDELATLMGGSSSLKPIGSTEFFDASGVFIDESVNEFNKHGNDSWAYDQRGVDIVIRDAYGYAKNLDYPFFSTTDRTKFSKLILKAAANDNYPFKSGGAHIRDAFVHTVSQLGELNLDERSSRSVIVYRNGEYWGVYEVREKVDDKDFTKYYYDQDEVYEGSTNNIQFNKTWGSTYAEYGTNASLDDWNALVNYVTTNDMSVAANVEYVMTQLDFNSMIDYFIVNSFMVSQDWLNWNTGWWRGLDATGDNLKWKYILWDQEYCLGFGTNYTGLPINGTTAPPCQPEDITVGVGHAQIFRELITNNPTLKEQYIMRYIDLINSYFSCEYLDSVLTAMTNTIAPEMPAHIAKWGGSVATWEDNVDTFRALIYERCSFVKNELDNCYDLSGPYVLKLDVLPANSGNVKLNTITHTSFPKGLNLYGVLNYHFKAIPKPGYTFSHWSIVGGELTPSLTSTEVDLLLSVPGSVTAHFVPIDNPTQDFTPIYYWHFNNFSVPNDTGVTMVNADYNLPTASTGTINYTGFNIMNLDPVNAGGSNLNLLLGADSGQAMRVRNPSIDRSLIFNMPSTGYDSLVVKYAVKRTNSGMLNNIITYTVDGVNYINTGLTVTSVPITVDYQLVTIDFRAIPSVNNNANFKVKINFEGNNNIPNGNNRYDNVALFGVPNPTSINNSIYENILKVYPNPTSKQFYVECSQPFELVKVVDASGRTVQENKISKTQKASFDIGNLTQGIYFVIITVNGVQYSQKLIKL